MRVYEKGTCFIKIPSRVQDVSGHFIRQRFFDIFKYIYKIFHYNIKWVLVSTSPSPPASCSKKYFKRQTCKALIMLVRVEGSGNDIS